MKSDKRFHGRGLRFTFDRTLAPPAGLNRFPLGPAGMSREWSSHVNEREVVKKLALCLALASASLMFAPVAQARMFAGVYELQIQGRYDFHTWLWYITRCTEGCAQFHLKAMVCAAATCTTVPPFRRMTSIHGMRQRWRGHWSPRSRQAATAHLAGRLRIRSRW
jgi:hypothetical protein